jgi:putative PEP-CTERM system TPR-repeat lipoprotein
MYLSAKTHSFLLVSLLVIALSGCGKSPDQHLQEGSALLDKRDYKAAILEFKTVLQEEPGNRNARLLLGKAYLANEAYADAEKELTKAREQGSSNDEVLPALAKALLKQNQFQKLLELELPTTVMNGKALASVHVIRAEVLLMQKKKDEALSVLAQAEQADSKLPELILLKARVAGSEGDFPDAHRFADAVLASNPKFVDGHYYKAVLLEAEGKSEQAIQSYQKVLEIDPKDWRAHLAISNIQLRRGEKSAGLISLQAAEVAAPNKFLVKYSRGIYELSNNNVKAANETLTQLLRVAPDYLPAQLASSMANLGLGNFEQSLKLSQAVLTKQPGNVLAARVVAASQIHSGDPKDALATLAPFLKSQNNDAQIYALAGEASLQSKDFQQASSYLKHAESLAPENAEIKNRQAASLLASGQAEQALSELESSAKLSDKVGQADVALVTINLKRKQYDKALQAIAALESKLPNHAATQNMRAVALLGKNDRNGARKALDKAIALDANFFPAVSNLAQLDLAEKNPAAARRRFETLLEKDVNNLPAMLALAELALLNKQEKDYVVWLEKAANAHPKALEPRTLLSRYHLAKKENSKALAAAQEALKSNPEDLQAINLLGATQMASKDSKASVESYRQMVQKAPKSAVAHLRLGLALAMAGSADEARASLNNALKIKPDFLEALDVLIRLEMQEKKPEAALQLAKKIQTSSPKSPLGFDHEGDIQISHQRYPLAAQAYQAALERGAGTKGLIKLHTALVRSGEAKTAKSKLEGWIKAHPKDLMARTYLAEQAMNAGQEKVAIAQYEEILRQRPNQVMAKNNLASLYHRSKDPRASELAEQAHKSLPDHPVIQDTLGWILIEQGQGKRGLELLIKAVAKLDKNPTVQYHYAVALGRDGHSAKAKDILQKLLAANEKFSEREAAVQFLGSLK